MIDVSVVAVNVSGTDKQQLQVVASSLLWCDHAFLLVNVTYPKHRVKSSSQNVLSL